MPGFCCHPQAEGQQYQRDDGLDQNAEVKYIANESAEDHGGGELGGVTGHTYPRKRRIAVALHSQLIQCRPEQRYWIGLVDRIRTQPMRQGTHHHQLSEDPVQIAH